jgi:hypothetical protein
MNVLRHFEQLRDITENGGEADYHRSSIELSGIMALSLFAAHLFCTPGTLSVLCRRLEDQNVPKSENPNLRILNVSFVYSTFVTLRFDIGVS